MSGEDTLTYDFSGSATQAYSSNMKLKGSKFCLYTGDADQNGVVDVVDLIQIYNSLINISSGNNLPEDLNGDSFVDVGDITLCYNNSLNLVGVITP